MTGQSTFRAALLDAAQPVPEGLLDGFGGTAGRRFSVYRNNVAVSLTEALATGFPVVQTLIGEENFRQLAGLFLRQHPPKSPLMMHYGQDLPDFVENFPPLQQFGYLGDVARLELAMRRSYHAADAAPIDPQFLAALAPEQLVAARVSFAPSAILLRSRWPVHGIWRFNTQTGTAKPEMRGENVLIARREYDPEPLLLPAGAGVFLNSAMTGATIGDALSAATEAAPEFDFGGLLSLLLAHATITDVIPEDTP